MLGEDADTTGTDEQTNDNENDAGQDRPSDEGDNPPYHEDHGDDPKNKFHGRLIPAARNRNISRVAWSLPLTAALEPHTWSALPGPCR